MFFLPVDVPGARTVMAVGSQPARARSTGSASARSMVMPNFWRTWVVRSTYQHWFRAGSHSLTSLATFWCRLTLGEARVRFSRSEVNWERVDLLVTHGPRAACQILDRTPFIGLIRPAAALLPQWWCNPLWLVEFCKDESSNVPSGAKYSQRRHQCRLAVKLCRGALR